MRYTVDKVRDTEFITIDHSLWKFPTEEQQISALWDAYSFFAPTIPSLKMLLLFFKKTGLRTSTGGEFKSSRGQIHRLVRKSGFKLAPPKKWSNATYYKCLHKLSRLNAAISST